ncbi:MAG: hypothetical protein AB8B83_01195 [Bdellovibrionales bacterium]
MHALWRTGSTYMWGKFRSRDELCCFFEPFHESLIAKTREGLLGDFARAAVKFRHETISRNYYEEYKVADGGGVENFRSRFIMDRYSLGVSEEDEDLEVYIQSLLDTAEERGQRPVLQFNRSILRAKWMKHHFGGAHIYLNRNLGDVYDSYIENGYYLPCYVSIVRQNADHPIFAEIANRFNLEPYSYSGKHNEDTVIDAAKRFKARQVSCSRIARKLSGQDKKEITAFFWATGLASATGYADMIVDTDRIISGQGRTMPQMFTDVSGLEFDFSDLRLKTKGHEPFEITRGMRNIIRRAVEKIGPNWETLSSPDMAMNTRVQFAMTM